MRYSERLAKRIEVTGSNLCVGLDPRRELTDGDIGDLVRRVVDETAGYAAAFKPNMAYFEAMGVEGIQLLEVSHVRLECPGRCPLFWTANAVISAKPKSITREAISRNGVWMP